jgi:hypothetical protein
MITFLADQGDAAYHCTLLEIIGQDFGNIDAVILFELRFSMMAYSITKWKWASPI